MDLLVPEVISLISKLGAMMVLIRGNVSAPGARRASFVTRALPVDCCC